MGGGRCWGGSVVAVQSEGSWQLCCGRPGDGDSPAVTDL